MNRFLVTLPARLRAALTPRRLFRLAGELLLFGVLLLAVEWYMTRDAAQGPAPRIEATLLDGRAFTLHEFKGRPALVYFWATWCPVCAAQKGTITSLAQDTPVITVAMQSDPREVDAYLKAHTLHWRVVADEAGQIARRYGVRGVPAVFVLDADGSIRFVTRGYTTAWGLRLRLWLAR